MSLGRSLRSGTYNYVLLVMSFCITCAASYVFSLLHAHVVTRSKRTKRLWLLGGAIFAGTAYSIFQLLNTRSVSSPSSPDVYWPYLLWMYVDAVLGSAVSLYYGFRPQRGPWNTAVCTLLLAAVLVSGQWLCLNAVLQPTVTFYDSEVLSSFCFVALFLSYGILRMVAKYARPEIPEWKRAASAVVMGVVFTAISIISSELATRATAPVTAVSASLLVNFSQTELYELAVLALTFAVFAFFIIFFSRQAHVQAEHLVVSEMQLRMTTALSEQRVIRLQNEALSSEIMERKNAESRLRHAAFHDSVTQLHNRVFFMMSLAEALKSAQANPSQPAALLYIDLDNFKSINDMFGHRVGDLVLIEIAQRMQQCAREKDVLARLQGDEFTLLYVNPRDMDQITRVAQRVLSLIEEPMNLAGAVLTLTASVGVCSVNPEATDPADTLRDADTAMYHAKRQGGSRCLLYNCGMHEEALAEAQAKLELKAAIEREEFELYYQPLVRMTDCSIYGMEALIRWNHPVRGVVGPGNFIPLAEETGHICAIGNWVLRQALVDFQSFRAAFDSPLLLTLNVASQQLDEAGYLAQFKTVLEESAIPPECLQLEITESVLLKDASRIGKLFREIRALGVKIAFDDFGTGYSSLSYLERYPIDTLKIDQSFVQSMQNGSVNADIVRLVVEMAHVIGMGVSAEGVEEPEQALALLDKGCVVAQGYLYSRPVTRTAMLGLLHGGLKVPESNVIRWQRPTLTKASA